MHGTDHDQPGPRKRNIFHKTGHNHTHSCETFISLYMKLFISNLVRERL